MKFLTTSGHRAVGKHRHCRGAHGEFACLAVSHAQRRGRTRRRSTATVSNAVNGTGRLSETTRQRVLAAARELGYAPASTARALARGATGVLGLTMTAYSSTISRRPAAGGSGSPCPCTTTSTRA
ncbi:LacI family DNA-binding transcriptional regulator [Streptomyces turgidiscabies]|uniref:LacI family DNA-binding transcriptional regulator n=1 Tax=Streptomyces TaxID=1883 RepID=UPI00240F1C3A|nr:MULTISPECIES: LacI family DNA-binding transcriptional regulator [Streptomyces]MDX3494458.1 LacI family DNA-binding transcriptional regulator [Streptomyces turgidiscabies]